MYEGDGLATAITVACLFCLIFTAVSIGGIVSGYIDCAHKHDVFKCQMNVYWTPVERNPQ